MSDTIASNYMGLNIPIPTVTLGPEWAVDLNSCLTLIDSHNHSIGQGVLITPDGLDIISDLTFNSVANATNLRTTRFTSLSATLSAAADKGCLYVVLNELYYNDYSGGHKIAITNNGSVAGSAGTITGLPSGTAGAAYSSVPGTFVFTQATSTGANMDNGTIILRYPGSYPSAAGNYIQLRAPSSIASGYNITFPALPAASGTFLTMSTAGIISAAVTVDNNTLVVTGNVLQVGTIGSGNITNGSITGTDIATNVNLNGIPQAKSRNIVVSNTNYTLGQSIVGGVVNSDGTSSDAGFTSSQSGGSYTITFTTAFSSINCVVATPNYPYITLDIISYSTTGCVIFVTDGGLLGPVPALHFMAFGQTAS